MTSPAQLSGWADRMLDSLGETGVTTTSVVVWLQNNLFRLNLALETGFITNSSGYIDPDMTQNESGIYEQMYYCSYYNKQANMMLGANGYDWTEIRGEDQGSIRRVSKNEIAKVYRAQTADCKIQLSELIDWYTSQDLMLAGQILLGDRGDIASGDLLDYCQPPTEYTTHSTVWRT